MVETIMETCASEESVREEGDERPKGMRRGVGL